MPFNPDGKGYDFESAEKFGIYPDETGHWQSRVPETGLILKGSKHPTFLKTILGEWRMGNKIIRGLDGRWYSVPNVGGIK